MEILLLTTSFLFNQLSTLLHLAVNNSDMNIITILLAKGAHINVKNFNFNLIMIIIVFQYFF